MKTAYTKEIELIELSGIKALHSDIEIKNSVDFKWGKVPDMNNEYFVLISSNILKLYYLRVNTFKKVITIHWIGTEIGGKGISEALLREQVKSAQNYFYKSIYLLARKHDGPINFLGVQFDSAIGYKIFGKYGYQMVSETQAMNFKMLMNSNNIISVFAIHHIYRDNIPSKRGKKIWDEKGETWLGKFNLESRSLSNKILTKQI